MGISVWYGRRRLPRYHVGYMSNVPGARTHERKKRKPLAYESKIRIERKFVFYTRAVRDNNGRNKRTERTEKIIVYRPPYTRDEFDRIKLARRVRYFNITGARARTR